MFFILKVEHAIFPETSEFEQPNTVSMTYVNIYFPGIDVSFSMIPVKGTGSSTYQFGENEKADIHINDFFISKYPVTQQVWEYIMGNNPSHFTGPNRPVECVSFIDIVQDNGFLNKLNFHARDNTGLVFRLPSESEWEYAARGGLNWKDGFKFSGSNNIDDVGWYDGNSGKYTNLEILAGMKNHQKGTETHDVGQKLSNQLGLYDMSGNVWEWCEDYFQANIHQIPPDGIHYSKETPERVLRGGCHHNWAVHCTVSKRYAITPEAKDECIGFRVAASIL